MNSRLILIFIIAIISNTVKAQTADIVGWVRANGNPIAAASVIISGTSLGKVTDSSGKFIFKNMNFGKYKLKVSAIGFEPSQLIFENKKLAFPIKILLSESNTIIEEVVISGTMRPVSKLNSPIPVEVYTAAYFKKNPTPNIFESLQMVNGIQPQLNCNVCNTGDIHINGMEGPYTMILIDGMPIVSSLSTVYGLAGIPNSMVKRIEIVKGPASTLYGSEAVGGLINIITKDAASSEKLKIDFSSTSFAEFNADISSKHQFKNSSVLLGINYFNFSQRRDINNDNFTDITLQKRLSVFNKWNFNFKNGIKSSLALRYITENRWGGELQWNESFKGTDSVYGESIKTNRAEIINTTRFNATTNLDISYNYHFQDSYYGKVKYLANQQVAFVQLRWDKKMGKHNLLAGIPFRYTFYDDNTSGTALPNGENNPGNSFIPGIFLQDELQLNEKITLLSGLRYDYNNVHGSIVSPRLSAKYAVDNFNTFRLSAGNGYRVVNLFTEDHAALTGAREVVIKSALKPERSWNGNLNYSGIIRHSKGFVNIDVSAFYTYFSNKIVGDFLTDPSKIIYDNLAGYAVSKGFTLNTDINFTNGLKIITGFTLMDVYQTDSDADGKKIKTPQLFAPKFSGTFAISYLFSKQKIAIDFTGRVNGPMYLPIVVNDFRSVTSPWFGILNLQITKSCKTGIELYTGIKNLLNFIPQNPLLHADDPFNKPGGKYWDDNGVARQSTNPNSYSFDPSYNYAAVQSAKLYAGIRWQIK